MPESIKLDRKHPTYLAQFAEWQKARDCYEGADCIEGRADYLPKHERETQANYINRLKRAAYTNFCLPIIENFTGQIWRNSPVRELPERMSSLVEDVDRQGAPADAFFKSVTQDAQVEGIRFVLVDYPDTRNVRDRQQEQLLRIRPYFVEIDSRRVLDWAFAQRPDGSRQLAWVVIEEEIELEGVPFIERKAETRYRVWYLDRWQVWRHDPKTDKAEMLDEGRNSIGEVPLVPFYSDFKGPFCGRSALHGVLSLCLAHYRKWSDRDNSEFWAGMPTWVFKNWPEDSEVVIGSGNGIVTPNRDSDVEIIEHSGTAIESMRKTEMDIISAIFDIAMRQVRRTTRLVESAESKRIDRDNISSVLQERARRFQAAETRCWQLAAKWLGQDPGAIRIQYNQEMEPEGASDGLFSQLNTARQNGDISRRTFLEWLQKRRVLDEKLQVDQELVRIQNEVDEMMP
ncbi:MAG: DUF4055 domain-containing protein [Deltaproteobacteria bacterium]|nr:DUF4055 domain-containing protein [Deltaproteobacteria bacterium]